MTMTSGTSAATRLRRGKHVQEGKKYGQILPTAEVIMKNEDDKPSLDNNKAHKKAAAGGRQRVQTDQPNIGGHYES